MIAPKPWNGLRPAAPLERKRAAKLALKKKDFKYVFHSKSNGYAEEEVLEILDGQYYGRSSSP
jgi:hypothetical protein